MVIIWNWTQHAVWKASLTPRLRHQKQKMTTIITINLDHRKQDLHYTHTHTAHMQVRTRAHSAEIISGRRWRGQSSLAHTKSCGRVDRRNPETILPLPYRPVPPQHSLWRNQDSPQHKYHSRQRLKDTCWHLTAEHKQQCAHVRIPGVTEPCIIIILWPLVDTWIYIYIRAKNSKDQWTTYFLLDFHWSSKTSEPPLKGRFETDADCF